MGHSLWNLRMRMLGWACNIIQQHSVNRHFTVVCSPCVSKERCSPELLLVTFSLIFSPDLLGVKQVEISFKIYEAMQKENSYHLA